MCILVSFIHKIHTHKIFSIKYFITIRKTSQASLAIRLTLVLLGKLQACYNLPRPLNTQVQAYVIIEFEAAIHTVKTTMGNITVY